jgi:cellulose synthase/poly-beta-1,6-N-acetylglucosamine synthase-like glycosyltransferase
MSTIAGIITLLITVPICVWSGYLLFILISAATAPKRKWTITPRVSPLGATIVIPAHNEEDVIAATLQSLAALQPRLPVVVIADNCTDSTAQLARDAGVSVIERQNKDERGKGFALAFAFDTLMHGVGNANVVLGAGADAYIVVDADTQVQPDFAVRLLAELPDDPSVPAAVQGRYGVMNGEDGWRAALMSAAFDLVNHVRLLAIDHAGGCLGLKGNGMAFTRGCLDLYPMTGRSVTEDLDYAMDLMQHGGIRVQYAPHAFVCAQMPVTGDQARSQRQRWEGGRYRVVRSRAPQLLKALISTRDLRFLSAMFELLQPPLAEQVAGCIGLSSLAILCVLLGSPFAGIAMMTAGFSVVSVLMYVFFGLGLAGAKKETFKALAFAPIYIVWKLVLYAIGLVSGRRSGQADTGGADAEWVRTSRIKIPVADERTNP